MLLVASLPLGAQSMGKSVRKGNREFRKGEYEDAYIRYRKALEADSTSTVALYDIGNSFYKMEQFDKAVENYKKIQPGPDERVPYNTGNALLQQKDYKGAMEAYIQALVINPDDMEAKENYAYALEMLRNQPPEGQQGGGEDNQDQNQQDQQNQQNQQDQNEDQQDQNEDQQQDQNQDQQDLQQEQPVEISKDQAERMLQAIQDKEKQTQDKVNEEKARAAKSRQKDKNW